MAAPDEAQVLATLKSVQELTANQLDGLVTSEVGTPLLGAFSALASAAGPEDDATARARKVHLLVMGYLMRGHLQGDLKL